MIEFRIRKRVGDCYGDKFRFRNLEFEGFVVYRRMVVKFFNMYVWSLGDLFIRRERCRK